MSPRFQDQVAVVTGAGRGIGAAVAKRLALEGAQVALIARTATELDSQVEEIERQGGRALAFSGDVADQVFVQRAFESIRKQFGLVSVLVNAAAIIRVKPFLEITQGDWDTIQAINVRGTFFCAKEALIQMSERHRAGDVGGAIVNVSSLGGVQGTEKFLGFSAYTASKYAVIGLTECLAVEAKKYRVRVNVVAPGAVDTKMLKEAAPFLKTRTTPDDVADVILPLCDLEGSITGTIVEMHTNE